jgi:hypothetical protein
LERSLLVEGAAGAGESAWMRGAAEGLRESMGVRLASPADRAEADRLAALARTALGAPGFAALWAAGEGMTLAEAVRYGLEPEAPTARGPGDGRRGGSPPRRATRNARRVGYLPAPPAAGERATWGT